MSDDRIAAGPVPLERFLQDLANILGPSGGPGLSDDEQAAVLDIARIAAQQSERIAAPMSTYLAGLACSEFPAWDRAEAILSLADQLKAGRSTRVAGG